STDIEVARFLGVWNWSQSLSAAKDLKIIASFWLSITRYSPELYQLLREGNQIRGFDSPRAHSRAASPAQLGTPAAWIGANLFCSGAQDLVRHLGVRTKAFAGLEGFFHTPVFAGVKRENGDSATGFQ